ncbi:carbohydrate ABC transporter permease [Paenibacillus qinlingensis]|uniref:Aldouronate transport system permease protein n=1 Tax=Paenibacillus qinlingensis TaxID=1837343 RepID=A0ABU1NUX3_9BACL|nr:carbohydrate ABC transporter permease [Paenibacillus qinlingensis]MDR6550881.1 putative aldouronate transport system permease protein [Paenibacillus qinlingensis]
MLGSRGEKWFSTANYSLLALFSLLALAPFVHIVAQSFSSQQAVISGIVGFWPIGWNIDAYKNVFKDTAFIQAFRISVARTLIGTILSVALTSLLAYPLSRPYILGRQWIQFMIVFTMLFSGGLIPTYLVVKGVGLINSFWALIIPGAISAFNVIIMRSFFQSVPMELEESARMDGCSNTGIFFRIVIPLSMPVIATIALFHGVAHWNAFFDAVLYLNGRDLHPLQMYLRDLILSNETNLETRAMEKNAAAIESLKAAALIVSTLPIVLVYPFLQRYFVKGILIGSVKG